MSILNIKKLRIFLLFLNRFIMMNYVSLSKLSIFFHKYKNNYNNQLNILILFLI